MRWVREGGRNGIGELNQDRRLREMIFGGS